MWRRVDWFHGERKAGGERIKRMCWFRDNVAHTRMVLISQWVVLNMRPVTESCFLCYIVGCRCGHAWLIFIQPSSSSSSSSSSSLDETLKLCTNAYDSDFVSHTCISQHPQIASQPPVCTGNQAPGDRAEFIHCSLRETPSAHSSLQCKQKLMERHGRGVIRLFTDRARVLRSSLSPCISGRLCAAAQKKAIVGPHRKAVQTHWCLSAPDTGHEEGFHTRWALPCIYSRLHFTIICFFSSFYDHRVKSTGRVWDGQKAEEKIGEIFMPSSRVAVTENRYSILKCWHGRNRTPGRVGFYCFQTCRRYIWDGIMFIFFSEADNIHVPHNSMSVGKDIHINMNHHQYRVSYWHMQRLMIHKSQTC